MSFTQIINEPGKKVKTFSSVRLSEKFKDFLDNEPSLAKLEKLGSLAMPKNEPGEKVKTFLQLNLSSTMINEPMHAHLISSQAP